MPRPGPRPYECVRRAWHSDRHHPIRGSLIQEVFRIVNELHSSATRKNREWQEKLPIVVLKAEEILYSKANSEAEYSNIETLWERVNDAIDTIIRRDETSETGKTLHPCIEAALHLGCTPRRSSRSQRNYSPRSYLRPENLDAGRNLSPEILDKITPLTLHCPTFEATNPLPCSTNVQNCTSQCRNSSHVDKFLMLPKNFSAEASNSSNLWSVFPLYDSDHLRPDGLKLNPSEASFQNPLMEGDKFVPQLTSPPSKLDALDSRCPSNCLLTSGKRQKVDCDLTLRLGSIVVPRASVERSWSLQVENGDGSTLDPTKFKRHPKNEPQAVNDCKYEYAESSYSRNAQMEAREHAQRR